jgi:hypothetical protein
MMQQLAPSGKLAGRTLSSGDLVRIRGRGKAMFRVRGIGANSSRTWLEIYGPVDAHGNKVFFGHVGYRAVAPEDIRAKVRMPAGGR